MMVALSNDRPIEIRSPVRADVYLHGEPKDPWRVPLIDYLDRVGIRVVGDILDAEANPERVLRIAKACTGCLSVAVDPPPIPYLQLSDLGPELSEDTRALLDNFIAQLRTSASTPAYAFMIGRLERDFGHARAALRAATEQEAGMTCLWSGDGRHRTDNSSVRVITHTLIEHASIVIADLSLGVENPRHENPSRAHEIGIASALEKPLMLCSREPRRYPYFSIGDMQMFFWADEQDLYRQTRDWIRAHREDVSRTVWNYSLSDWGAGGDPNIRPLEFNFDPKASYRWPEKRPYTAIELSAMTVSVGVIAFCLAIASGFQEAMKWALYPAIGFIAVGTWLVLRNQTLGKLSAHVPTLLVLSALAFLTLVVLGLPN